MNFNGLPLFYVEDFEFAKTSLVLFADSSNLEDFATLIRDSGFIIFNTVDKSRASVVKKLVGMNPKVKAIPLDNKLKDEIMDICQTKSEQPWHGYVDVLADISLVISYNEYSLSWRRAWGFI